MLGILVALLVTGWLILHRFRVAWLEHVEFEQGVKTAIEERRHADQKDQSI